MSSRPRPPLRDALSTPKAKGAYVRRLFDVIADRYDLITVLLSYGQDRRWKRRLASMSAIPTGVVLDLACGTGDIAFEMARRGGRVVALDITQRMIEIARSKARSLDVHATLLVGDMAALPFGDGSFDVVTTGYGLRNVPDLETALNEIHRVLKPDGHLLSLDFNRPANGLVRSLYLGYLTAVGSVLGPVLHGDPDTYRYIPESIRRYPGALAVSALARQAGFSTCTHIRVLGGLMAIHSARK